MGSSLHRGILKEGPDRQTKKPSPVSMPPVSNQITNISANTLSLNLLMQTVDYNGYKIVNSLCFLVVCVFA